MAYTPLSGSNQLGGGTRTRTDRRTRARVHRRERERGCIGENLSVLLGGYREVTSERTRERETDNGEERERERETGQR